MRLILVILTIFIVTACGKATQTDLTASEQDNQQIINALNVGDHEHALNVIQARQALGNSEVELEYWKAQAYSLRAGVDVYSLFPLMKMKLFDVAISDWGEVSEQAKRANTQLNTTFFGVQSEDNKQKLEEKIEEISKLEVSEIEFTISSVENFDYHSDQYSWCNRNMHIKSEHFPDKKRDSTTLYWNHYGNNLDKLDCDKEFENHLENSKLMIQSNVKAKAISFYEKKIKNISSRENNQQYLKAALSLYESVPVIREIPNFDDLRLEDIYNSLSELKKVRARTAITERLGRNSQQQMGMLAAFLIAGSLKKSIKLDEVDEPFDIACKARPEVLVENYPHFKNGLVYLLESIKGTAFEKKNASNIEKLKSQIDQIPEELSSDQKESIIESIHSFIADNC